MGGENRFRRDDVEIPRGGDLARQLVIVGVVLLAWFGAFNFSMGLPTESAQSARADERRAERIRAAAAADSAAAAEAETPPSADGDDATTRTAGAETAEPESTAAPTAGTSADEAAVSATPPADPVPAKPETVTTAAAPPVSTPTETTEPETTAEMDPVTAIEQEEAMSNLPDVSDHPPVSFEAEVMPIVEGRCLQCHGEPRDDGTLRIEEGLDMRTHEAIMAGSTWGDVVVPGDPVGSYMLELIVDGEMPDEGPRLLPREVRIITAWIAQGAPDN